MQVSRGVPHRYALQDTLTGDFEQYERPQPPRLERDEGAVHNGVAKKRPPREPARQKKHIYSSEVVTCELEGVPL